jgi:hypothetical protein
MKWLATLLLLAAGPAGAIDFFVEEEGLQAVPAAVAKTIRTGNEGTWTDDDGHPCRFEGKPVDLDADGRKTDWVVTTRDACAWAASAGPIVLVRGDGGPYRVVLLTMGYDLTLGSRLSHGLVNVARARATAETVEQMLWKYDGNAYDVVRAKTTTPDG